MGPPFKLQGAVNVQACWVGGAAQEFKGDFPFISGRFLIFKEYVHQFSPYKK